MVKHYEILPPTISQIVKKRWEIHNTLLAAGMDLDNITIKNITDMFYLYNYIYFKCELTDMAKNRNIIIQFGFKRGIKTAGLHQFNGRSCKISVAKDLVEGLFKQGENRIWINGLNVRDRLEALQVLFEHELLHMYMTLKGWADKIKKGKGRRYYSAHGALFQELAKRFFLHTDYRHMLHQGDSTGHLTKERCKVGMNVWVVYKGDKYQGEVVKCNPRRAKVQSDQGSFIRIFEVPYQSLRKVK